MPSTSENAAVKLNAKPRAAVVEVEAVESLGVESILALELPSDAEGLKLRQKRQHVSLALFSRHLASEFGGGSGTHASQVVPPQTLQVILGPAAGA